MRKFLVTRTIIGRTKIEVVLETCGLDDQIWCGRKKKKEIISRGPHTHAHVGEDFVIVRLHDCSEAPTYVIIYIMYIKKCLPTATAQTSEPALLN